MLLPQEYGYVVLTAAGSYILLAGLTVMVSRKRKEYNIKYPKLYADASDGEKGVIFNCYQRAHQNTLEQYTLVLSSLLISGLEYPTLSTTLGVTWIIGRIFYARGYYTGNPEKRSNALGLIGELASVGLLFSTIATGLKMLKYF